MVRDSRPPGDAGPSSSAMAATYQQLSSQVGDEVSFGYTAIILKR